jgi:integrase
MKFRVILRRDLENACSPFRVVQRNGREIEWVNHLLDQQRVRGVAETTLRSYAYDLLHFLRWWVKLKRSTTITRKALTKSTLLDYIRFQTNQQPQPAAASINRRVGIAERAIQLAFPDTQTPFVREFRSGYWRPVPLGTGSPRPALSRLRVRTPKRVIVPLSNEEVAQFWTSFRTARDLAIVGLMLLDGLRSCEVLALDREDLLLSESQMRVHGKGSKLRWLPMAAETIQLLDHYLRWERPPNCGSPLFVVFKGRARGNRMTAAGLRSLFRHHRRTTDVSKANPHRFRHYAEFRTMPSRFRLTQSNACKQVVAKHVR